MYIRLTHIGAASVPICGCDFNQAHVDVAKAIRVMEDLIANRPISGHAVVRHIRIIRTLIQKLQSVVQSSVVSK